MVKSILINLVLICLFLSTASANTVELYYDGFWSHHRAAKPVERMLKNYELAFKLDLSTIPSKHQNMLFNGFSLETSVKKPNDYILYYREYDDQGSLIKEIGGSNDVLWNLSDLSHKRLTEKEKKVLHNYIKDVSCIKSDFLSYKK